MLDCSPTFHLQNYQKIPHRTLFQEYPTLTFGRDMSVYLAPLSLKLGEIEKKTSPLEVWLYLKTCSNWNFFQEAKRVIFLLELHSRREIHSWAHHPFDLWAHELTDFLIFQKDIYFPAQLLKNKYFIGGDLLTLPSLFNFKTCWRGTKVSLILNTAWMYTLGIVKKTWQR